MFLVAVLFPSIVLVALGLRMIGQERELAEQRVADDRRRAVTNIRDALVEELEGIQVAAITRDRDSGPNRRAYAHPAVRMLARIENGEVIPPWDEIGATHAARASLAEAGFASDIERGERAEFRQQDFLTAIQAYQTAAHNADKFQSGYADSLRVRALGGAGHMAEAARLRESLLALSSNVVDEHGVPFSFYAAKGILELGRSSDLLQSRIQEEIDRNIWHGPAAAYLLRDVVDGIVEAVGGSTEHGGWRQLADRVEREIDLVERVQERGINFEIVDIAEGINTEETLYRVSHAIQDLTILGSHQVKAELTRQYGLKALFTLNEPVAQSWAVRVSDYKLLAAANDFIQKEYHRDTYNTLYSKYLSRPKNRKDESKLLAQVDELSPYDEFIKANAERHSFDWRLIAAQMYQESQFDPEAVSYAGAEGLMQIMPATANELGVENLYDPKSNISAGVKYMKILRDQFEQELPLEDKTWFTLASYNAGFARVKNARTLADKMGLDSNRWFGNVEKAMLALSKPYTRDGELRRLCHCGQAVIYVREIRSLYHNYVRLTETTQIARAEISLRIRDI